MLYLAEVQKQKGGLLGGGSKTELKLLACQRTDQSWNTVSEELITAEEANKLNDGALILVELNPNRQVQRIQEAGRPLVNILQNFSRQLEKFKVKEEEIDQWKQSLTFQAQELNRREMDLEARLEQLPQIEEDSQRLETQQQEIETSRQEIEGLRQEIERNRTELEGAWEHLRGEQRRLEESKEQESKGLDEEQTQVLSELLDRLSSSVAPNGVRENLNNAFEMVESKLVLLNPHWHKLEQQRIAVNEQQAEVDRLSQILIERQEECSGIESSLQQQTAQLNMNTAALNNKQELIQMLTVGLQQHQELYQLLQNKATVSGDVVDNQLLDVELLEKMSLENLHKTVQDLQEKLNIDSSFVHDQEQELIYKQETIEELQSKINQGSELELGELEAELADEKDLYQMLNETLVGQRRSLVERQEILKQHQAVLLRRQKNSLSLGQEDENIDWNPILARIESQRQQQQEVLQNYMSEVDWLRVSIEQAQEIINEQTQQHQIKRQEVLSIEQNLLSQRTAVAESWGRVNLYQETLQPIQDSLDGLRQSLQVIAEALAITQETGDSQLQAITQMRQTVQSLVSQPQTTG